MPASPPPRLSRLQRLIRRLVPARTFTRMEQESREWQMVCGHCGYMRNIWDLGGIRAGASGRTATVARCPDCGRRGWHQIIRH